MGGLNQPQRGAGKSMRGDDRFRSAESADESLDDVRDACWSERNDEVKLLFNTVENEIIPRLMLLHRSEAQTRGGDGALAISADDVVAFTERVIASYESAAEHVENLLDSGAALETVYLQLMSGAARRLGDLWNADEVEFTDVTIGLSRLQRLLHGLSENGLPIREPAATIGQALFVPVPGEQHTFGLNMVSEFFRASGWDVYGDPPASPEALIELARIRWFDVMGFSIGGDRRIEPLATLIRAIRKTSRNRSLRVMVGGPLLLARPQVAVLVGADATAPDARQAMLAAERLLVRRDEGR